MARSVLSDRLLAALFKRWFGLSWTESKFFVLNGRPVTLSHASYIEEAPGRQLSQGGHPRAEPWTLGDAAASHTWSWVASLKSALGAASSQAQQPSPMQTQAVAHSSGRLRLDRWLQEDERNMVSQVPSPRPKVGASSQGLGCLWRTDVKGRREYSTGAGLAGSSASGNGAAEVAALEPPPPAGHGADSSGRQVEAGRAAAREAVAGEAHSRTTGLFGHAALASAEGFQRMPADAVARSEELINDLRSTPPSLQTIRIMDEISDVLCTVLDAAELCRHTHPDKDFVEEARRCYVKMSAYVQRLNASKELYDAVVAAIASGTLGSGEALRVATMLRLDFERGGVHLPEEERDEAERLSSQITRLGMIFGQNILEDSAHVDIFPASKLAALPGAVREMMLPLGRAPVAAAGRPRSAFGRAAGGGAAASHAAAGGLRVGTQAVVVSSVLKWVADPEVRKRVYMVGNSAPGNNLEVLADLIAARQEQAQMLGHESFAHLTIAPLVARTPETVRSFLLDLSAAVRPKADQELGLLSEYKGQLEGLSDPSIRGWDRSFYTGLAKARAHDLDARKVAEYFPLESCMAGLGVLLGELFGCVMREERMTPGESWAADVRKFSLERPHEGKLGTVYLDLYPRAGKYTHAAHFTLRCGRRHLDGSYQLPVVALVCNFPRLGAGAPQRCLLTHADVETLFHEFGHALHSLLSHTDFQHLSGTRAAVDYVEVPSNLLEYFAWDRRVLGTFARHHVTGEPIPAKLVAALRRSKTMFAASDLQSQVIYALVDQAYYGQQQAGRSTTDVLAEIQNEHSALRHVPGTHWQARFSHLVGYGAGYYSYLYAKCLAAEIWHTHFAEDPLRRDAGESLRGVMLQHGGARDPALILQEMVGASAAVGSSEAGVRPTSRRLLLDSDIC